MNISGINFESVVDGDGVRVVVYVSGCLHNCKACHNPASHPFDAGKEFTQEIQEEIISYIKETPFISGITLSGGDPMYQPEELGEFIKALKEEVPRVNIWIYSGFTYEEILIDSGRVNLMDLCDVLVDGRFIIEQRDITLAFRGSKNQRIIDIKASRSSNSIKELIV